MKRIQYKQKNFSKTSQCSGVLPLDKTPSEQRESQSIEICKFQHKVSQQNVVSPSNEQAIGLFNGDRTFEINDISCEKIRNIFLGDSVIF